MLKIKEILDIFYNEYPKEEKQLEDYITNLQESHCEYKEKCNEYNVGCIKEMLCNYQKTNNNLQTRIDKAIYYLELDMIGTALEVLRGDE